MKCQTQMEAACRGIISPEMREALRHERSGHPGPSTGSQAGNSSRAPVNICPGSKEAGLAMPGLAPDIAGPAAPDCAVKLDQQQRALLALMASGRAVIPANRQHRSLKARAIGEGLKTKVNVNLGLSSDSSSVAAELDKARLAIEYGADAIMDLSNYGDTGVFRRELLALSPLMIGTVPVYDAAAQYGRELADLRPADFLGAAEAHARDGVDFITVHCGVTRESLARLEHNPRVTSIVSRGGSLLHAWMAQTGRENPYYEYFDELLAICRSYDVTLSLGDAGRPGSISDATDAVQVGELVTLGELTRRARAQQVQVIIEGPGHMALNEVTANVLLQKKLCHGAPFYVLGPLVTDIAPGYDHITAAIGGAQAAAAGADFLCYVTPAEHLRLPDAGDLLEGLMAARIAAHAGDLARQVPGAAEWDQAMSQARFAMDWEGMFRLALHPEKARSYRAAAPPADQQACSMCAGMCAVKTMNQFLKA